MAIVQSKKIDLESLIVETKASCERIKEINGYIDRLKKKIKVVQGDPNLAYYEYTCSEFEAEKFRIASSLQGAFIEIKNYDNKLQDDYERLQKSLQVQQIMNRYCMRALKEDSLNYNYFKKRSTRTKMEEDLQKMLKERKDIALKMEQTSPIIDTLKVLLAESDKTQQI